MNGYRWTLLAASYIKRVVSTVPMGPGERLDMLEMLAGLADHPVGGAAIAMVEPADPIGFAIMNEAMKLDDGARPQVLESGAVYDRAPNAAKVLLSPQTFAALSRLNPSLGTAMALFEPVARQT